MTLLFPTDVDKIAPPLVKALGELRDPGRSGKVAAGQRHYKFMTLPDLLGAVRDAFAKHDLAVLQTHVYVDGEVEVVTTILHESGQLVSTPPFRVRCQPDPQSIGSAGTYLKRYALAALVGLAGDDDDDGQQATRTTPARKVQTEPPGGHLNGSPTAGTASPQSVKYLWTLLRGLGTDEPGIRSWVAQVLDIDAGWSTKDLSQQQVSTLINRLKTTAQTGDTTAETPVDSDS
jgi:hypothetical protein